MGSPGRVGARVLGWEPPFASSPLLTARSASPLSLLLLARPPEQPFPHIDPPAMPSPATFEATIAGFASQLSTSRTLEQGTPVWVQLSPDAAASAARLAVAAAARLRLPSLSLGCVLGVRVLGMMEKDEEDRGRGVSKGRGLG